MCSKRGSAFTQTKSLYDRPESPTKVPQLSTSFAVRKSLSRGWGNRDWEGKNIAGPHANR